MRPLHLSPIIAVFLCCLVARIAPAGPPEVDWTASYNGPASYWESVNDATVRDGCLYVAGFATVEFQRRGYITVKYAPDGTEAWSRIYEGPTPSNSSPGSTALAVAVDESGNVYVTGYSSEESKTDIPFVDAATLKYSPEGNLLWEQRYRGSGGNVQPSAIMIDPGGFVYVTGGTWINGGFDVFLLKYDLDGNLIWSRTRGQAGNRWDNAFAMALAENGDIVLGGYTQPGDVDVYVLKYGPDGALGWEWTLPGIADVEEVIDLTVDGDGNTYALAQYAPPGRHTSLLTVRLSPTGDLLWSDVYSGQSTGDYGAGIALAPDGNVFVAGAAWENGSQNAMTLLKYTPTGQRLWVRSERGGYFSAECNDMVIDAEGAAYMSGVAFNENNMEDYLTAKFDGTGNLLWVTSFSAPEGRSDYAYQVRVGEDGRVYVIGDSWRGFDRYFDITSVAYRQGEASGIGTPADQPELIAGGAPRLTAHPNPTRGEAALDLYLPDPNEVRLSIYDATGRLVRKLLDGKVGAGVLRLAWDGRSDRGEGVAPGVYFIRLATPNQTTVSRITRLE
jgi:hypothetical protein